MNPPLQNPIALPTSIRSCYPSDDATPSRRPSTPGVCVELISARPSIRLGRSLVFPAVVLLFSACTGPKDSADDWGLSFLTPLEADRVPRLTDLSAVVEIDGPAVGMVEGVMSDVTGLPLGPASALATPPDNLEFLPYTLTETANQWTVDATDENGDTRTATVHFTANNAPEVAFDIESGVVVGEEATVTAVITDADADAMVTQTLTVRDADGVEVGSTTAAQEDPAGTYTMTVSVTPATSGDFTVGVEADDGFDPVSAADILAVAPAVVVDITDPLEGRRSMAGRRSS